MTREEAKKLSNVLKAYSEGKIIQYQENGKHRYADLRFYDLPDQDNISLETQEYNYRIKPEPKYRPFKSQEECWNEMHKHPDFGFIRKKGTKAIYSIAMIDNFYLSTSDISEDLCDTLYVYEFLDGEPFGIKEE